VVSTRFAVPTVSPVGALVRAMFGAYIGVFVAVTEKE